MKKLGRRKSAPLSAYIFGVRSFNLLNKTIKKKRQEKRVMMKTLAQKNTRLTTR
jgi:hypothetical protein